MSMTSTQENLEGSQFLATTLSTHLPQPFQDFTRLLCLPRPLSCHQACNNKSPSQHLGYIVCQLVLSSLDNGYFIWFSPKLYEAGTVIIFILQVWKPSHREGTCKVRELAGSRATVLSLDLQNLCQMWLVVKWTCLRKVTVSISKMDRAGSLPSHQLLVPSFISLCLLLCIVLEHRVMSMFYNLVNCGSTAIVIYVLALPSFTQEIYHSRNWLTTKFFPFLNQALGFTFKETWREVQKSTCFWFQEGY